MNAPAWIASANFYQIFPERFANGNPALNPPQIDPWDTKPSYDNFLGGDLPGIIQHLPYLADMHINALYLNPIFAACTNHRYDAVDYFAIDPQLGDLDTFAALIAKAHDLGIRVILDGVFNHCGNGHKYFRDVMRHGADSKYVNWFFVEGFPVISQSDDCNYKTCSGCYYLPKWNVYNPEVRRHHLEVAKYWLNRGIDGWRLDVPYYVNMSFWREFHDTVKTFGDDKYLVAEDWRDPVPWLETDLMDGVMNYTLRDLILAFSADESLDAFQFAAGVNKLHNRIPESHRTSMFNLLDSHDTERVATRAKNRQSAIAQAFALLYSLVGTPVLYYGDENGMLGENDPGCRAGMEWNTNRWNTDTRNLVTGLLKARSQSDVLQKGSQQVKAIDANTLMVVRKYRDRGAVLLLHRGSGRNVALTQVPLKQARCLYGLPGVLGESYRLDDSHPLLLEGIIDETQWKALIKTPQLC
ncbi:glycoside hydrolase family 13 protein [Mobiluncus mulieris]|uniref:glycoside hydrolase family 13 protein n=1 Tax=Mobiluncus mulieris TaxID=2052 RepID=UPI000E04634B|nr:glycoside hydrolase family 13 protein [Mobiluncus mulieris]STY85053.1 Neopullulanase 2 [Mobiluncus mulieris]